MDTNEKKILRTALDDEELEGATGGYNPGFDHLANTKGLGGQTKSLNNQSKGLGNQTKGLGNQTKGLGNQTKGQRREE